MIWMGRGCQSWEVEQEGQSDLEIFSLVHNLLIKERIGQSLRRTELGGELEVEEEEVVMPQV